MLATRHAYGWGWPQDYGNQSLTPAVMTGQPHFPLQYVIWQGGTTAVWVTSLTPVTETVAANGWVMVAGKRETLLGHAREPNPANPTIQIILLIFNMASRTAATVTVNATTTEV